MSTDNIKEGFLRIYDEYADAIFRYAYFQVSDREYAKDLAQDTFIKAWEYLSSGKKVENMRAFLYRITINAIIDHRRKKKTFSLEKITEEGYDLIDEKNEGEEKEMLFEGQQAIRAVAELPEKYRDVLTFRYVDDLSVKEIAEITNETENNVSVRIHRGLEKLKNILNKNGK